MTPVFLFLVFLWLTAVPPGAASDGAETNTSHSFEVIARVNNDIAEPLKFGDIMEPPQTRNAVPCTANGCKWPKTGSTVVIPYELRGYKPKEKRFIESVMKGFESSTCIQFVKRRKQTDYVRIFSGPGCWSYLGRLGGQQDLSLKKVGCLSRSTVEHELLHLLGFHHEQSRSDRDDHVNILYENIQQGRESNFDKADTNNLGTPYDFDSVMHYGKYDFSSNGQPTIVAKSDPDLDFGHATQMSANDIERINQLYDCSSAP